MKCLLVEDDQALARELSQALRDGDWLVEHAANGQDADFLVRTEAYDTLILDVGLPESAGLIKPRDLPPGRMTTSPSHSSRQKYCFACVL